MFRTTILSALTLAFALSTAACADEELARDPGFAPRSLDGTDIDGGFHYDRDGNFVFDEDARQAFDYFLTAEGELSEAELHAWVEQVIVAQVSPSQRALVSENWYAYVDFREIAAAALEEQGSSSAPAGSQEALLSTLDAQFGGSPFALAERQRIERAFALRAIYETTGTDRVARDEALAVLDADAAARFAASRAGRFLAAREQIEHARAAGASTAELDSLRAELFETENPGASERLAALDARRAQWAARVEAHEHARAELAGTWIGAPEALDVALDALDAEAFSASELRRVQALRKL